MDRLPNDGSRQHRADVSFLDFGSNSASDHRLPRQVRVFDMLDKNPAYATGSQRPQSSPIPTLTNSFAAHTGHDYNTFGAHFMSDGNLPGQELAAGAPAWDLEALQDGTIKQQKSGVREQGFSDVSGDSVASPDMLSLASSPIPHTMPAIVSRKRPRESLDLPRISSKRDVTSFHTTPSPAMTGPTTPSSADSFDFGGNQDWLKVMGGNPKEHFRELREEQRETERQYARQQEQLRRDEELARELSEKYAREASEDHSWPSSQDSWNTWRGSSGLGQIGSDVNDKSRRPKPLPAVPSFTNSLSKASASSTLPVKKEILAPYSSPYPLPLGSPSRSTETERAPFSNFINLANSSSDAENDLVDLEEIKPSYVSSFGQDSQSRTDRQWIGASQSTKATPPSSKPPMNSAFIDLDDLPSNPSTPQQLPSNYTGYPFHQPDPYQEVSSHGGNHVYGPSVQSPFLANMASAVGNGVASAARGAMNAAYGLVGNQFQGFARSPAEYEGMLLGGTVPGTYLSAQLGATNDLDYSGQTIPSVAISRSPEMDAKYRERLNYLTNDPTRTKEEIKSLLENIRPDEDLPPENREGTPEAMVYPLMEHQKLGLAWMKQMEGGSNKGGILADDMGLGKTIQALALIVARKSPDPLRKTTLIVAPVALLKQWEREIAKKLKSGHHALTTYILHGSKRHTTWDTLRGYDVVLTTFGTLSSEYKRREGIEMTKRANPNWTATTPADRLPVLGDECKWYRVIIDEAQCIKNKDTQAAKGASVLQALSRFCMTGTPMMNGVGELYSLIHFLRIIPYNDAQNFRRDFTNPLKGHSQTSKDRAMQKLQILLKAILLRRTKKSKIDGKPIIELPQRITEQTHAIFSEDEECFYRAIEKKTQLQFNKYLRAGTVGRNYANALVLLLRLRQACCHPHLIPDFGIAAGGAEISPQDMLALARDLAPEVVERIIEQGAITCPICLDAAENATIFTPCGHSSCSECFARISDPAQAIADGHGDTQQIKCPNCRGKVEPSKVTDYNAFKKVHMSEEAKGNDEAQGLDEEGTESGSDSDTEDEGVADSDDSINDFIVTDGDEEHFGEGGNLSVKAEKRAKSKKGKGKAKEKKPPKKSLAQLKKEGMRNAVARRKYLRRLEKEFESSAKLNKTMEILTAIQKRRNNEKTIIFSQFTSLLDLLEIPIIREGWKYKRYDGSMTSNARNEAVLDFADQDDCRIMLISLKAGNAGLNLVAASQVIILDPFWNPYIEEQAVDRAHRIGQLKRVEVHRILIPNTVEDRILLLQEKKRELIEGALDENASKNISRLGTHELAFLFGVPP